MIKGVVEGKELGPPMTVTAGEFELLVPSSGLLDLLHLRMRYTLDLEDSEGRKRCLHGFKVIEDDPGSDSRRSPRLCPFGSMRAGVARTRDRGMRRSASAARGRGAGRPLGASRKAHMTTGSL